MTLHFPFDNTYACLPDRFFARVAPTPVAAPRLIRLNTDLAVELGLDPEWLAGPEALEILAGRRVPDAAEPIAMAYAGHQFGHFVPQLGDGRAILLGEVVDRSGVRRDLQLKGSGRTPFSRGGDGRVAIDAKTLRKHYRDELDLGTAKANAQVAGFLFNSARNGNVTAQIFWLKTRAGWKETPSEHRHVGAFGTFDVHEMSDEALERIVFGAPPNLPPMTRAERRKALAPILQAIVSAASGNTDEPGTS